MYICHFCFRCLLFLTKYGEKTRKYYESTKLTASHQETQISRTMRKPYFCLCENKGAGQLCCKCTLTAQLISTFVFATPIEQFLFFHNPKFQDSSQHLCLHRPVYVGPGLKTGFLATRLNITEFLLYILDKGVYRSFHNVLYHHQMGMFALHYRQQLDLPPLKEKRKFCVTLIS